VKVYEPRKCDICVSDCKGGSGMPLEVFNEGVRCDLGSEFLERLVRQRKGLE